MKKTTFVENVFLMQRIGVIGAGHFGKYHLKALKDISEFELVGFYDIDKLVSEDVRSTFNIKAFPSYEALLDEIDIVDIVVPTVSHYECAVEAIRRQKNVFIEKPVTSSLTDAENLIKLAEEASVKVQVGHIERFNPAFIAAIPYINNPMFIEIHRLQPFTNRSTDISVVLNLMIHDIDIVLSTVNSNIKKISASGVKVITSTPDIANARLEFENGCVANITASRIALKNIRRCRFFQKETGITVDFLNKTTEIISISKQNDNGTHNGKEHEERKENDSPGKLYKIRPEIQQKNAITEEMLSFMKSINENSTPVVTLYDGFKALQVAHEIIGKVRLSNEF